MITKHMTLDIRRDADIWAAQFDLPTEQESRLAIWLWEHKPGVGCTYEEHPFSSLLPEDAWSIVEGDD